MRQKTLEGIIKEYFGNEPEARVYPNDGYLVTTYDRDIEFYDIGCGLFRHTDAHGNLDCYLLMTKSFKNEAQAHGFNRG